MIFHTPAGFVTINTEQTKHGLVAELTSVSPRVEEPPAGLVDGGARRPALVGGRS